MARVHLGATEENKLRGPSAELILIPRRVFTSGQQRRKLGRRCAEPWRGSAFLGGLAVKFPRHTLAHGAALPAVAGAPAALVIVIITIGAGAPAPAPAAATEPPAPAAAASGSGHTGSSLH